MDRHTERFDGLQRDSLSRLKITSVGPWQAYEDRHSQDED
jgi:hypothetical protein